VSVNAGERAQTRHWEMVLSDPQSPAELRAKAAKHLAIQIPVTGTYASELDTLVESYMGVRKDRDEQRHPIAERVYHAITTSTLLGGNPNTVVADTETVLDAFAVCKTEWMRRKTARALVSALFFHRDTLPAEIKSRIESALDSVTDFDVFQQQPEERDFLGLIQDTAIEHETATQNL
jgi:hypothetical protein